MSDGPPDLPDNIVITGEVRIVQFINPEGKSVVGVWQDGEASITSLIGMLEMAKINLIAQWKEEHQ